MHMHNSDSYGIIAVERLSSGQHFIHHGSDGINIAFSVCNASTCLFGTDIMNASYSLIGSGFTVFSCKFCNSEIHYLDSAVGEHHNILRFYITVNDTLIVSVLKRS